jgi:hypothetical protein
MQWNGRGVIGSGRALLRRTSSALACRNTRTREARNVFGRGGLLGDGTRSDYLPHVRCYNVRRGRPHTHAHTPFTHACMHTYTRTHMRTYTQTIRARIYALRTSWHTHAYTYTLCVPDEKRFTQSFFFFRHLLTIPKIFLVFLITRCIYWRPTLK